MTFIFWNENFMTSWHFIFAQEPVSSFGKNYLDTKLRDTNLLSVQKNLQYQFWKQNLLSEIQF